MNGKNQAEQVSFKKKFFFFSRLFVCMFAWKRDSILACGHIWTHQCMVLKGISLILCNLFSEIQGLPRGQWVPRTPGGTQAKMHGHLTEEFVMTIQSMVTVLFGLSEALYLSFIISFERICCKTVRFGWAVMLLIIYYPPFMVQIDTACKRNDNKVRMIQSMISALTWNSLQIGLQSWKGSILEVEESYY